MMATHEQPDWLNLPSDLVELIAQKSRDAVTGLDAFRSVCRTWRAAAGPAPRLLLPVAGAGSEHALVFPQSRGWSIVVDARDTSCHLSHHATGTTVDLPKLNAIRDGGGIAHLRYLNYANEESRPWRPQYKIMVDCHDMGSTVWAVFSTYLRLTDELRFAVHVPPAAGCMTIMMNHTMLGRTGMVFCRPGDAAWTKLEEPARLGFGYFDFAYHDGKMFGLDGNGETAVFDATTLAVLRQVQPPPETPNLASKMHSNGDRMCEFDYVHLVALPSKLVLVRTSVKSSRPVAFTIFELGPAPEGLAWIKVKDAGNYEIFLDGYHATFTENGANSGTRIYYVHDVKWDSTAAAYCYSMQDSKLECVYRSPEDSPEFSTKPSWFLP